LDLRRNPGGLLDQSIKVSSAFLNGGDVVSTRGRRSNDVQEYGAEKGELLKGVPIVVIIDNASASAQALNQIYLYLPRQKTRARAKLSANQIFPMPSKMNLKRLRRMRSKKWSNIRQKASQKMVISNSTKLSKLSSQDVMRR